MKNEELFNRIKELGVSKLQEKYTLLERPLKKFKDLKINGMGFNIVQYEIIGVGNLSIMDCMTPFFQMLSYIITPYYKDIPMFTADYVLKGDKRDIFNEVYSLVTDKSDATYTECLKELQENMESCKIHDNENKPLWYDHLRPVFVNKTGTEADDEEILKLFESNLDTLIEFEQKSEYLKDIDKRIEKYDITKDYVNNLVEKGGVSTNVFKAALGVDDTKEFYFTNLFGNNCFKPYY